jgi:hypothetical protein
MSKAEKLKQQGTEKYKAGDWKVAIDLFAQAAALDPKVSVSVPSPTDLLDPPIATMCLTTLLQVYLSNLSAAQVRQ